MAGYRYLCNENVLENYAVFSLHVLYAPWLPDLYFFVKTVHIIFKILR